MRLNHLYVNQQCVIYKFQCDLCDSSYVGYTLREMHQRLAVQVFRNNAVFVNQSVCQWKKTVHFFPPRVAATPWRGPIPKVSLNCVACLVFFTEII